MFNHIRNIIFKLHANIFVDQWNIAVVPRPIHSFLNMQLTDKLDFMFKTSRNHYYADPFGITLNNINYIVYEAFDYWSFRGIINCIEFDQQNVRKIYHNILPTEGHASYPFLIGDEGKIFCLPENSSSNKLTLYEASIFPNEWIPAKDILTDFQAIDPTIVAFNGRLWLFCTKGSEMNEGLYVFYSDNILGPWQPHQKNPVKRDVKSSRSAGTPFIYEKKLYRPAQDCSKEYGGRIIINKIIKLSPTEFMEEAFNIIDPPDNKYCGIHTLAMINNATLIDVKRRVFSPASVKHLIQRNLLKIGRYFHG